VTLTQRILRSSALNLVDHLVRLVVMLVVTPILVSQLGLEKYGLWLVLTAAVSFLGLLDGGITLSGTRFLARAHGGTGEEGAVLGTLRWLYHRIGWACLGGTLLLSLAVPWLVPDASWWETGRAVVLVLGTSMAARFFLRLHLVVLKAQVRYDLIVAASLVKVVLQSVLVVALLRHGHGLVVLALAHTLADLTDQILIVMFSRAIGPGAGNRSRCPQLLPDILRFSGTAFLHIIGQQLRSGVDPFIVSRVAGLGGVPLYSKAVGLVQLFDDLVNAVLGGTLLSAFSRVEGENDADGLKRKFLYTLKFSVALALIGGTGFFVLGPPFLVAWLGDGFAGSGELLHLLLLPWTLKLMQHPGISLLYSTNRHLLLTRMTFVGGALNLVLSLLLASRIGIKGVALATCLEMSLFYVILMPRVVSKALHLPVQHYLAALLKPAAQLALPLALWAFAAQSFVTADFFHLAVAGTALVVIGGAAAAGLLFNATERQALLRSLRPASTAS
jgi:O-antigen/teichoic acid export membrane protein